MQAGTFFLSDSSIDILNIHRLAITFNRLFKDSLIGLTLNSENIFILTHADFLTVC